MGNPQQTFRILHVITSLGRAGAETVLVRLVGALGPRCHHTVACLGGDAAYAGVLRNLGAEVVSLDMPSGRLTLGGLCSLVRLIRRVQPDVVQTWMYHADLVGGLASRLAGARAVVWGIRNSDLDPNRTKRSTRLVVKVCAALSSSVPNVIITCSRRARDIHVALGYRQDKFVVVPNGYDLSIFRPDPDARKALRSEWGVAVDVPLVGMVARWSPQKDHANFLAAAARVRSLQPAARFVLIGPEMSGDNPRLAALIDAQGLRNNVLLLGSRTDIAEVMNALDVHVLSSAYGEAFPNVVAEAMACGVPCVATDVGDTAYIVGDTGWIVPPGDSDQLASAIERALAEDTSGRSSLALRCRQRIEQHFSISRMADQYFAVWRQAMQNDAP